jgi:uncharacterized membrane protein YbaN (DUF454 family)
MPMQTRREFRTEQPDTDPAPAARDGIAQAGPEKADRSGTGSGTGGSMKRAAFTAAGILCTGVGIAGVFLPVLPTTGPILIAAWCFSRSSGRLHGWLVRHRVLGRYIGPFLTHRAISVKGKLYSIGSMWLMIVLSGAFLVHSTVVRIVLAAAGAAGTAWILSYRTLKPREPAAS